MNAVGRGSQRADAVGIAVALHQEGAGIGQGAAKEWAQEESEFSKIILIPRERAIRNPPTDKKHGDLATVRFTKKVGPNLGFEYDHHRRPHGVQRPAYAKCPVQREI